MLECEWHWGQEGTAVTFSGKAGRIHLMQPRSQAQSNPICKNRVKPNSASPGQDGAELNPPKMQGRNDRELFPCWKLLNRLGHFSLKKVCLRGDIKEGFMGFLPRERDIVVRLRIFLSL